MNRIPLCVVAVVMAGCAARPPANVTIKESAPTRIGAEFEYVSKRPDVASYQLTRQHVWHVGSADVASVFVKVENYPTPKPAKVASATREVAKVTRPAAILPLVEHKAEVRFAVDSASIDAAGSDALSRLITEVGTTSGLRFVVVNGYADSTGSSVHNLHLSERRARAVMDYLVRKGVDTGAVRIAGHGELGDTGSEGIDVVRARNRRVDVTVGSGK